MLMNGPKRNSRIRKFFIEMHRAIQLEKTGEYITVFTDEPYVHSNQNLDSLWFKRGSGGGTGRPSGKGKRLVILHAITKGGFLCEMDAGGMGIEKPGLTQDKMTKCNTA